LCQHSIFFLCPGLVDTGYFFPFFLVDNFFQDWFPFLFINDPAGFVSPPDLGEGTISSFFFQPPPRRIFFVSSNRFRFRHPLFFAFFPFFFLLLVVISESGSHLPFLERFFLSAVGRYGIVLFFPSLCEVGLALSFSPFLLVAEGLARFPLFVFSLGGKVTAFFSWALFFSCFGRHDRSLFFNHGLGGDLFLWSMVVTSFFPLFIVAMVIGLSPVNRFFFPRWVIGSWYAFLGSW